MIQVLKSRSLKRGELKTDLAVVEEVDNAWISACVDPVYDEEYEKRYSARAINKSVDELRLELKRRIKYLILLLTKHTFSRNHTFFNTNKRDLWQ